MHSTRMQKKSDAQKSGISEPYPESPEKLETPGKSPDSPGSLNTSEKQQSSRIFNLTCSILRKQKLSK
jgi:hypothetical protein